jgi:hypothetical protein
MKTLAGCFVFATALLGAAPQAAWAQHPERVWRGDIRSFERHDVHRWRSGAWRHGSHAGRFGWWWVAGGVWYFYPQPVYPYPDPYRPPTVIVETSPAPPVVVQMPAQVQPAPQLPSVAPQPAAQFWYYCEAQQGYYPYVAACPTGWKTVPVTPPGAPQ